MNSTIGSSTSSFDSLSTSVQCRRGKDSSDQRRLRTQRDGYGSAASTSAASRGCGLVVAPPSGSAAPGVELKSTWPESSSTATRGRRRRHALLERAPEKFGADLAHEACPAPRRGGRAAAAGRSAPARRRRLCRDERETEPQIGSCRAASAWARGRAGRRPRCAAVVATNSSATNRWRASRSSPAADRADSARGPRARATPGRRSSRSHPSPGAIRGPGLGLIPGAWRCRGAARSRLGCELDDRLGRNALEGGIEQQQALEDREAEGHVGLLEPVLALAIELLLDVPVGQSGEHGHRDKGAADEEQQGGGGRTCCCSGVDGRVTFCSAWDRTMRNERRQQPARAASVMPLASNAMPSLITGLKLVCRRKDLRSQPACRRSGGSGVSPAEIEVDRPVAADSAATRSAETVPCRPPSQAAPRTPTMSAPAATTARDRPSREAAGDGGEQCSCGGRSATQSLQRAGRHAGPTSRAAVLHVRCRAARPRRRRAGAARHELTDRARPTRPHRRRRRRRPAAARCRPRRCHRGGQHQLG